MDFDWKLTCRACLEMGEMVSLFDWDENNEQLSDKYLYCCGVEIDKSDTLPTLLCLNCVDRLIAACQFKAQCLSSNEILQQCLEEYLKQFSEIKGNSSQETVSITIKQKNGHLLQCELSKGLESQAHLTQSLPKSTHAVVTKAPAPKKRGRRRKYPNEQGQIDVSPYQHKKPRESGEQESLVDLLASGSINLDEIEIYADEDVSPEEYTKPSEDNEQETLAAAYLTSGTLEKMDNGDESHTVTETYVNEGLTDDPDVTAVEVQVPEHEYVVTTEVTTTKKRGRPRKYPVENLPIGSIDNNGEGILIQETELVEHTSNTKPKKKYVYDKMHTCETCGASFPSNATLQIHIRRHLGIKPFVCSECGYTCVQKMELERHMKKHTGAKPYKCRICDRRFGDFGSRQKHERLHVGFRPYRCSVCDRTFTYSYVLTNHMLTHTGEKNYACVQCNKKFAKSARLKHHNKIYHRELYLKQQMEIEAKMLRQKNNVANMTGVMTGKIVDGHLQFVKQDLLEYGDDEREVETMVIKDEQSVTEETETAVAGMQQVALPSD